MVCALLGVWLAVLEIVPERLASMERGGDTVQCLSLHKELKVIQAIR